MIAEYQKLAVVAISSIFVSFPAEAVNLISWRLSGNFLPSQTTPTPPFPNLSNGSFEGTFSYDLDQRPSFCLIGQLGRCDYSLSSYSINFFDEQGNFVGNMNRNLRWLPGGVGSPEITVPGIYGARNSSVTFYSQMRLPDNSLTGGLSLGLIWENGNNFNTNFDNKLPRFNSDFGSLEFGSLLNKDGVFDSPAGPNCPKEDPTILGGICYRVSNTVVSRRRVPEPSSLLGILALSTLGTASAFKRKLKPSKLMKKKTIKVG
jgi:hypothetical protein